ncbi:universal stress protein [uncultured Bradyrhizobium sp.]|uniref:universal stress protein n=1 Tax=Bradyrhizobium sp. TaxID=376 RepID=UPI00262ACB21|nr:universal stress protein [uncultured Bradyrhizobium sp.]
MLEYFSLKKQAGTVVRQIMVATDGSGGADRAVDFAAELAKAAGCALSIITIGGNLSGEELRQLAHDVGCSIGDVLDSLSGQILAHARERAQRVGLPEIHIQTGWGDAATAIIETAQRENVDVIVIGRRGRGRLAGLLLGSVSQKLVSLSTCPVMVVP